VQLNFVFDTGLARCY